MIYWKRVDVVGFPDMDKEVLVDMSPDGIGFGTLRDGEQCHYWLVHFGDKNYKPMPAEAITHWSEMNMPVIR
jgi:hypothetical protein